MQLTNEKTEYIIVKADIQSEWDTVKYAVIHVPDDFIKRLRKFDTMAKQFVELGYEFHQVQLWNSGAEFLTGALISADGTEGDLLELDEFGEAFGGYDWSYIKLEPGELDAQVKDTSFNVDVYKFERPQNRIGTMCLCLSGQGAFSFHAQGEYSGEQVWTEGIAIADLEAGKRADWETVKPAGYTEAQDVIDSYQ